jgi:hypothetical protein
VPPHHALCPHPSDPRPPPSRAHRYVLYHYMSNEHCAEWLARRLTGGSIGAVLIISRFENLGRQIDAVERRGVRVTRLMRQPRYSHLRSDDR